MAPLSHHETIECKTIDGISLDAWFYPAEGPVPAPAIIMSHGVRIFSSISVSVLTDFSVQLRQRNERD